jgi:hypothetical protein
MAETTHANPHSAGSLSKYMIESLPADTQLKNAYECIALAAHAALLAIGFRLVGLGEDHKIEAQSDPSEPSPLPAEWNASKGSYAFRYKHGKSSMEFLLKINSMGNRAMVTGMGMGDDKPHTIDVKVADFVSESNLPTPTRTEDKDLEAAAKDIQNTFISAGRLSDFGSMMRVEIIQKLIPSLHKEGYEETFTGSAATNPREPAPGREDDRPRYDPLREERDPPARPLPLHDPLAQPRRPLPEPIPGFEDEFEIGRPQHGGIPGGGFPRIGDRDLYPAGLGPNDPLRGGVGPGLGPMGGGGMHPTFDDPLFTGQGQRGPGFNPQAPPGSRFDDPGPGFGGVGGGHPRGAGMGGRPPNPFGGFGDGDFI